MFCKVHNVQYGLDAEGRLASPLFSCSLSSEAHLICIGGKARSPRCAFVRVCPGSTRCRCLVSMSQPASSAWWSAKQPPTCINRPERLLRRT